MTNALAGHELRQAVHDAANEIRAQRTHPQGPLSRDAVDDAMDGLGVVVRETIPTGRHLTLPGGVEVYGSIRVATTKRNPKGRMCDVPARVGVRARPTKAMREWARGLRAGKSE